MAAPVEAAEAEAVDLTGDDEGPPGLMTVDPIEDPDMQRAIGASLGMSGADGAGTSGGASGSSSRARRRTTAAAGAAMSGPFALLWCESARHVGKAPRCAWLMSPQGRRVPACLILLSAYASRPATPPPPPLPRSSHLLSS